MFIDDTTSLSIFFLFGIFFLSTDKDADFSDGLSFGRFISYQLRSLHRFHVIFFLEFFVRLKCVLFVLIHSVFVLSGFGIDLIYFIFKKNLSSLGLFSDDVFSD